jgi:hypothetical protein
MEETEAIENHEGDLGLFKSGFSRVVECYEIASRFGAARRWRSRHRKQLNWGCGNPQRFLCRQRFSILITLLHPTDKGVQKHSEGDSRSRTRKQLGGRYDSERPFMREDFFPCLLCLIWTGRAS